MHPSVCERSGLSGPVLASLRLVPLRDPHSFCSPHTPFLLLPSRPLAPRTQNPETDLLRQQVTPAGSPATPVQPEILPKTFIPASFPKRVRRLLRPVRNTDSGAPVLEMLFPEIWSRSGDCYPFEKPSSKGDALASGIVNADLREGERAS